MLAIQDKLIEIDKGCGVLLMTQDSYCGKIVRCDNTLGEVRYCKGCQATRKTLLQTTKECAENTLSKIKSKEKHGIIIIDVKKVDDAMVERALNPSKQQEKEIEEEQLEIKLKTHAISIRNQLCQDLINELKLNQTIEFCKKELSE